MSELRNPWKLVLSIFVLLVAAQVAVSLTARTRPFHNYLSAHLERAFGRPVQVKHFNIEILPSPRIYATGVTVGENPAFGYEYFLHAEHLMAGLRWSGFLRGHFEFGTLSLSQSSLTLVRNREGRWNLEDWLPQARKGAENRSPAYGPSRPPTIANRLERIEIEDGRIDFKSGDVKQPFALTGVSGSVEQLSPGRWKVQLNAQPWRSGVTLQSTGTIEVAGDIAGTSARLQPASLSVRWDTISLADLFRLLRGRDYGVRGTLALQGTAKSGAPPADAATQVSSNDSFVGGDWSFSLKASAIGIHRWDLTERADNPKLNATVQGRWNIALGTLIAENLLVESAVSNLHGVAHFHGAGDPFMQVKFDSAQVQAADVLSWCRAFQPDIADGITADEFFRGSLAFQGWPVKLLAADLSTMGGTVKVGGVDETLKFGPTRAVVDQNRLVVSPVRIALLNALATTSTPLSRTARRRPSDEVGGELRLTMSHDFSSREGAMGLQGHIDKSENALKLAAAFGHMLNHGWDLTGPARADLRLQWSPGTLTAWNGVAEVNGAELAAAGLNRPLQLQQVRLEFRDGKRSAQILQAVGFGATWSGTVVEGNTDDPERPGVWNVDLHADHLDATELDRWVGPRARPGWLLRLLPSLLGGTNKTSVASELVRRLNVIGNVEVDAFSIEKLKLQQVHLQGSLHDLRLNISDGRAQWAGGNVRATMIATFLPQPRYDVRAQLDGIQLAQLPLNSSASERLAGAGSGTLHLRTAGVGRDELLQKLGGAGEVHLTNLEFRGWDVNATIADGESHPGISRWPIGDGTFRVRDRTVILDDVRLDGGSQFTLVNGTVNFAREANLSFETSNGRRAVRNTSASGHVLKIIGPLDGPTVSSEVNVPRQPAD